MFLYFKISTILVHNFRISVNKVIKVTTLRRTGTKGWTGRSYRVPCLATEPKKEEVEVLMSPSLYRGLIQAAVQLSSKPQHRIRREALCSNWPHSANRKPYLGFMLIRAGCLVFPIGIGCRRSQFSQIFLTPEELIQTHKEKNYRTTPFIVTFCEGAITHIDIQAFIEMGLHVVRFRLNNVTRNDKLRLLKMLNKALEWVCEKYDVVSWPIALCLDLPSILVRTGIITNRDPSVTIKDVSIITLTNEPEYIDKCSAELIYMDGIYIMETIVPGVEVTLRNSNIVMVCIEVIDECNVKCKVERSGVLESNDFVCVRGVKSKRPSFSARDIELVEFAKEFKIDMVTIHSVRDTDTIKQVKELFKGSKVPVILSSICEEEGLQNIDSIIKASDAIVLGRDFLAHQISDKKKMNGIQMQISGKCRQAGKPFFLSGNIMESTLTTGVPSASDLSDVTNAVMQGAGFILKEYKNPVYMLHALRTVNSVCKSVESLLFDENNFLRLSTELQAPVSAAEACILASALTARQFGSPIVVLPTVTGRTAVQLSHMAPDAIILAVTTNVVVAKRLQIYKGVVPIVYTKARCKDWTEEVTDRVHFAVEFGIKKNIVKYGNTYVTLRKTFPWCSYCDHVSTSTVMSHEFKKHRVTCNFHIDEKTQIAYDITI